MLITILSNSIWRAQQWKLDSGGGAWTDNPYLIPGSILLGLPAMCVQPLLPSSVHSLVYVNVCFTAGIGLNSINSSVWKSAVVKICNYMYYNNNM